MDDFNQLKGSYLREFISDLKDDHKLVFNDEDALFYAKGFYAEELTDKLYYFGKEKIKIVYLNKDECGALKGVTIVNKRSSSITDIELALGKDKDVELRIKFKDIDEIVFHNQTDSDRKNSSNASKQIKEVYSLLTE